MTRQLTALFILVTFVVICTVGVAQLPPPGGDMPPDDYPVYAYPHRTSSFTLSFADMNFKNSAVHYDTATDIIVVNPGDPKFYGDRASINLKRLYRNFSIRAYGGVYLSRFTFFPDPGFGFRVDGNRPGGIDFNYDTPAGADFSDSFITTKISNGQSVLEFITNSRGLVDASGRFDINVTIPGDWSTLGKGGHQTEMLGIGAGWTIARNFTFDGTNTIFSAYSAPSNGNWPDLHFILHGASPLKIIDLSSKTFITTDTVTLKAQVGAPNVPVRWTIEGRDAAGGIGLFPTNEVQISDSSGISTFTFIPSNNPSLMINRAVYWTMGSDLHNTPISFEVIAATTINGQDFQSKLSETNLGPLSQDETDIVRQEYVDYDVFPVPIHSAFKDALDLPHSGFNDGNYGVQLSEQLRENYDTILTTFYGQMVVLNGQQFRLDQLLVNGKPIPVRISSSYRNPQRNKSVGSVVPDSHHTRGRALDLVPDIGRAANGSLKQSVVITVNGNRVTLDLHKHLYPRLNAAAEPGRIAFPEAGNDPHVALGDRRENHIHVHW